MDICKYLSWITNWPMSSMNNDHIIDVMDWEVYTIEWEAFTMPGSKHIRCTCWWYVAKMIASCKPEKRVGKPKEEWCWWRGVLFAEKYINKDCFSCIQLIILKIDITDHLWPSWLVGLASADHISVVHTLITSFWYIHSTEAHGIYPERHL